MFCNNCGNIVNEGERFCQHCGAPITPNTTAQSAHPQVRQPIYQNYQQPMQKPIGMKWYKFIVYFQLFLASIISVGDGIRYIDGSMEGTKEQWEVIYSVIPQLHIVNIVFGIISILYVGFLVVIRIRLINFKKNGPMLYLLNFVIQIAIKWVWIFIFMSYFSRYNGDFSSQIIGELMRNFVVVIYIALNAVYFRKRKFIFNK